MYNAPWNTSDLADADVWADFADYAEDIWSDDWTPEDDDDNEWGGMAEDAYLDSYWESLTEM